MKPFIYSYYKRYYMNIETKLWKRSNSAGIRFGSSSHNTVSDNTANSNINYGILFSSSSHNTVSNNTASSNNFGIYLTSSSNNSIFNNYFNNTFSLFSTTYSNYWNTTYDCSSGQNIIGGPCIGGNFWAKPDGTGFSETCPDADSDGICDSSYTIVSGNVDYLPLARKSNVTILPTVDVLNPIPAEPQSAGTNVTWACRGNDNAEYILRYMFRMRGPSTNDTWVTTRGFRKGRKWTWQTTTDDIGETDVKCVVKDPAYNKASKTYYNYEITS
jgi:parallel beta-helix repeat protein